MIIGLCGTSGTGKTTISQFFADEGFVVIDYDKLTREIYKKGSPCLNDITKSFGTEVLFEDGSLNRRRLGEIVFASKEKLELLNSTVHKYILKKSDELIEENKGKMLLLDAPTLFESGLYKKCDKTVAAIADRDLRIQRICKRDAIGEQQAAERINSQHSDEFFYENCDFVIDNSKDLEHLKHQCADVISKIIVK